MALTYFYCMKTSQSTPDHTIPHEFLYYEYFHNNKAWRWLSFFVEMPLIKIYCKMYNVKMKRCSIFCLLFVNVLAHNIAKHVIVRIIYLLSFRQPFFISWILPLEEKNRSSYQNAFLKWIWCGKMYECIILFRLGSSWKWDFR